MSNRLLEVTVSPDWQEIDRQQSARGARLWREAQITIIAAVLVSLLLGTVATRWPALQLVRLTLFTLVTWAPPLWFLIRSKPDRQRAPRPWRGCWPCWWSPRWSQSRPRRPA